MTKGPNIRAARRSSIPPARSRAGRLGASFFYLATTALAAVFVGQSYAQVLVEPLDGSVQPSVTTIPGMSSGEAAPLSAVLDQPIQLSAEQIAIGLMPASQFFATGSAARANHSPHLPQSVQSFQSPYVSSSTGEQLAVQTLATMSQPIELPSYHESATVARSKLVGTTVTSGSAFDRFVDDVATGLKNGATRSRKILGERGQAGFKGYIGAGIATNPAYSGADHYAVAPTLVGHIEFADIFRISHLEGFEILPLGNDGPVSVALSANWREGRQVPEHPVGLREVDGALEIGGELAVTFEQAEIFVDVEKGLWGGNLGWEVETGVRSKFIRIANNIDIAGQIAATWADETYMDALYSVSAAEAAVTGLDIHDPSAGLHDLTVSLEALFFVSNNVGFFASVDGSVLVDEAARSPIVADEGSMLQLSSNLGLIYRF